MSINSDTTIGLYSFLKVGVDIRRPFPLNIITFYIYQTEVIFMENNKVLNIVLHGKTIRFYRSLKGVSCRELAEISGVKQSLLHKFETGRRNMTQLSNYRITRALQSMGFDLEEILVINLYIVQKHGGITSNE